MIKDEEIEIRYETFPLYYFNKFVYILRFVQFHSIQFYFSNDTPDRAQQNNGYTKIHHLNTYTRG